MSKKKKTYPYNFDMAKKGKPKARKPLIRYNRVSDWRKRLLVSVITEGNVRFEWAHARFGQVVPVNWASSGFDIDYTVAGYSIQDAYNLVTRKALEMGVEWLIIIEDDVMIPPNTFLQFADYIDKGKEPVVSGLYYTKADPGEPLIFRGRGNGAFQDWKYGDKVRCDGLPMGCLLLHTSLLRWLWDREEQYKAIDGADLRRVFETPKQIFYDPERGGLERLEGTQDLHFFDRIIMNKVLKKTGWKKLAKKKYPFLCDTEIFCQHIDRATGTKYPLAPKENLK